MAESALLAAAKLVASGGDAPATPSPPEPVEADAPDEAAPEPAEGDEAPEEAEGKADAPEGEEEAEKGEDKAGEDELDESEAKKRKAQVDRAYARLETKKRAAKREIAAARAELERERATIKREREAASQYLQGSVSKIEKFDRLVELAKAGDDALIDELGIDLEKLTLRYLERGTPAAAERKTQSEVEKIKAELATEREARAKAEREATERQTQAWRLDQSRQFVAFARGQAEAYPHASAAAEDSPQEVVDVAWRILDLAKEQGRQIDQEGILAEVDFLFEKLAERHLDRHSKIQARRLPSPAGSQVPAQKLARGLASGPRRQPAATPRSTESLSDNERLSLAARMFRQSTRGLSGGGIGVAARPRDYVITP